MQQTTREKSGAPSLGANPRPLYPLLCIVEAAPTLCSEEASGSQRSASLPPPVSQKLQVTPELIAELAHAHLRACVLYQNELSNALARANVEGEDARRQERLRIWGFAS